jgi:ribosomal protein S18 acetylase RimI-like enzyme
MQPVIRPALSDDLEACLDLWVRTTAARDGKRVDGVAERARPAFDASTAWFVADSGGEIAGFVLCTEPEAANESGRPAAPLVRLLGVGPEHQGSGLGRRLLGRALEELGEQGFPQAELHVLVDNIGAVRLYESTGWTPHGETFPHSLLGRPTQTYRHALARGA